MDVEGFNAHLKTGVTTVARAWDVTRRDGLVLGFTDHDRGLAFDGITYTAETGLTARAVSQTTGLSVDNAEAVGVLNSAQVSEEDIRAGRYGGAVVRAWLVNWQNPEQRKLQFRGTIGEITSQGPGFKAELRGLTEQLNTARGAVYQKPCAAVLGDGRCRFDLNAPGFFFQGTPVQIHERRVFRWDSLPGFATAWFERGTLRVLSGAATGLVGVIKFDAQKVTGREIELWEALPAEVVPGDLLRLEAGCDKSQATCRIKFNNFLNFRGFPTIPGDDWLTAYPVRGRSNNGGRLAT